MLDEQQQRVEQARREIQRAAVATAHLLLRRLQHEVTERIAARRKLGEFSHLSGTFQGSANDFDEPTVHCADVRPLAEPDPGGLDMQSFHHRGLRAGALSLVSAMLCACGGDDSPALDADGCTAAPAAPVDTAVCRGKANFHDRTLAGLGSNGRACSDCHMDSQNFQLTPAAAQVRFAQMTASGVDDPLFRAIDADDFRVNGAAAHEFTNLTQN
ncbi:MAG TPA: hypothetical protein VLD35_07815, partial [Caldimonas sp.]|nr:hypothetical protein [Caldimonas sp.]